VNTKKKPSINKYTLVNKWLFQLVRISALDLNNVRAALVHRAKVLKKIIINESAAVKAKIDDHPFGEDVKMVRQRQLKPKLLTPAEKDDVVIKYESGMTMTDIANEYRCHYTTVGYILRSKGVEIRDRYSKP
jgi:hypothetical protein